MKIKTILNSGEVVRFHNHSGIDKQKNSEHQWGVALIVEYIYPNCSKQLLLAALTHDAHEYFTGDIPFPIKQHSPELKGVLQGLEIKWECQNGVHFDLSKQERTALKVADVLEGMWYCLNQVKNGNLNAKRPFRKWREFLDRYMRDNMTDITSDMMCRAATLKDQFTTKMEEL